MVMVLARVALALIAYFVVLGCPTMAKLEKRVAIYFSGRMSCAAVDFLPNLEKLEQEALNMTGFMVKVNLFVATEYSLFNFSNVAYKPPAAVFLHNYTVSANEWNITNKHPETNVERAILSMYNNAKAFQLISTSGVQYDVVVKYRSDVCASSLLPPDFWSSLKTGFSDTELHVPCCAHSPTFPCCDYGGLNDQIAYGSFAVMHDYSALFTELNNLLSSGTVFHPETLLRDHIRSTKHALIRPVFNYSLDLRRFSGNCKK